MLPSYEFRDIYYSCNTLHEFDNDIDRDSLLFTEIIMGTF